MAKAIGKGSISKATVKARAKSPVAPARKASGQKKAASNTRIFNARPDTLDFRDKMYTPTLIEVPTVVPVEDFLKHKIPVLDQGQEGACTGFGLATVANYLLARRVCVPDRNCVSPRMFYELARRYDEWPGEAYSGSSARGAMKGWNKHGVCAESDWAYKVVAAKNDGFNQKRMSEAKRRPLGAYFRVNHLDLIAMHAAIAEVGVLYATANVHEGWQNVGPDGKIKLSDKALGGHAFAIVAYDAQGFWIQNSWGKEWGRKGLAQISYDDWLKNGTDVWVARLGVPVVLSNPVSFATAHAAASGQSAAYSYAELRPHLVSIGNEGLLKPGGDYGTTERELATIFEQDIPQFLKANKRKSLLLFAHGGLVGEAAAVQRVAEYRRALMEAGVFPLALMWHTDYWSTVTNVLQDAVRRRRPEGLLDRAKDFMLDRLDDALEPLARALSGKMAWSEMKENALAASSGQGAVRLVLDHLLKLKETFPDLELHLVSHSAGSIILAPLVQLWTTAGSIARGPMQGRVGAGLPLATCTMWAPACTVKLFDDSYRPAIESRAIANFSLFCLNDKAEQKDDCANIYNKSLLYLVSNAFEDSARIPGFREGVPILGMEKTIRADEGLKTLFATSNAQLVVAPNNDGPESMAASTARKHGDFDDDAATVRSTFMRILASAQSGAAPQAIKEDAISFAASATHLSSIRLAIDEQTRRSHP
ncbi:C1 family peptidase [Massilia sp. CF038]|uniref:C1 family peptidase n=1 Tax=Massilia sp. CF038 TaxID=1881045 RepID=UPI00091F5813|nr:C1 family peptidase [Massilia sp. CF038]SHG75399.1 Papain family cysteine protease [Massilia sp. CF038]